MAKPPFQVRKEYTKAFSGGFPVQDGDKFNPSEYIIDQLAMRGLVTDLLAQQVDFPAIVSGLVPSIVGNNLQITNGVALALMDIADITPHDSDGSALPNITVEDVVGVGHLNSFTPLNIVANGGVGDGSTINYVQARVAFRNTDQKHYHTQPSTQYYFLRDLVLEVVITQASPNSGYPIKLGQFTYTDIASTVTSPALTVDKTVRSLDYAHTPVAVRSSKVTGVGEPVTKIGTVQKDTTNFWEFFEEVLGSSDVASPLYQGFYHNQGGSPANQAVFVNDAVLSNTPYSTLDSILPLWTVGKISGITTSLAAFAREILGVISKSGANIFGYFFKTGAYSSAVNILTVESKHPTYSGDAVSIKHGDGADVANNEVDIKNKALVGILDPSGAGAANMGFDRGYADLRYSQLTDPFVDLASATTTDLSTIPGRHIRITGVATIASLGAGIAGLRKLVRFADSLVLTHNATSLILPWEADIHTKADDTAEFVSLGSGNWLCVQYSNGDDAFARIDEGVNLVRDTGFSDSRRWQLSSGALTLETTANERGETALRYTAAGVAAEAVIYYAGSPQYFRISNSMDFNFGWRMNNTGTAITDGGMGIVLRTYNAAKTLLNTYYFKAPNKVSTAWFNLAGGAAIPYEADAKYASFGVWFGADVTSGAVINLYDFFITPRRTVSRIIETIDPFDRGFLLSGSSAGMWQGTLSSNVSLSPTAGLNSKPAWYFNTNESSTSIYTIVFNSRMGSVSAITSNPTIRVRTGDCITLRVRLKRSAATALTGCELYPLAGIFDKNGNLLGSAAVAGSRLSLTDSRLSNTVFRPYILSVTIPKDGTFDNAAFATVALRLQKPSTAAIASGLYVDDIDIQVNKTLGVSPWEAVELMGGSGSGQAAYPGTGTTVPQSEGISGFIPSYDTGSTTISGTTIGSPTVVPIAGSEKYPFQVKAGLMQCYFSPESAPNTLRFAYPFGGSSGLIGIKNTSTLISHDLCVVPVYEFDSVGKAHCAFYKTAAGDIATVQSKGFFL